MADGNTYPQIPATVWWGFRAMLNRRPNASIDERYLQVQLNVQESAARQYLLELKRVGLVGEDNKATPLAERWRLEESYADAVRELAPQYPQSLRDVAPPGDADRQKVVAWFQHEGLGQGSANNKAATYLLITSSTPSEITVRSSRDRAEGTPPRPSKAAPTRRASATTPIRARPRSPVPSADAFPLNINLQIHISADAGTEQIESIFSAMKRYLYDDQGH